MNERDHGGGIDAAIAAYGGTRGEWLDLSTGINPAPYPIPPLPGYVWTDLPDRAALHAVEHAARVFWQVPDAAEIVVAQGASALIAALPGLWAPATVSIPTPTYNEHAAAFAAWGWTEAEPAAASVVVHPNNPDGRVWAEEDLPATKIRIIDESFGDVCPDGRLVHVSTRDNHILLKSFGKFWGLAGLRLGFAICCPELAAKLRQRLGPWTVSGPALHIANAALRDPDWATETRARLNRDADHLDRLLRNAGFAPVGGTSLFRTVNTPNAADVAEHLAQHRILVRVFPYSSRWVRFGLPPATAWDRLEMALGTLK